MNMQPLLDAGWKLAVILGAAVLMVAAFRAPQPSERTVESVRAQRFILVDANGKTLGEWGQDDQRGHGAAFILYNQGTALTEAIGLRATEGKAELLLRGGQDNGSVMLATDKASSSIRLYDNCLDSPCNGSLRSCLAKIDVGDCVSQLRLQQARRAHANGSHIEQDEDVLLLPETPPSQARQPGK